MSQASENKPLISICVPAYNHEKYIQECLDAIIAQTYQNLELIVIDDGSTDQTWSKIQEMKALCEKRFKRVVFITQPNAGTCITFNRMFDLAQGEYIAISASDDKFLPNAIEILYKFISSDPETGLVVGKNLIMDGKSQICFWNKQQSNVYNSAEAVYTSFTEQIEATTKVKTTSSKYGKYETLLKNNHIANGWLFRKSLLSQITSFTPEAPLEDWWFMMQVSKVAKIRACPEETFCYRWHGANTVTQKDKISKFAYQTIKFEEKNVNASKNPLWIKTFKKVRCSSQTLFKLGSFFILYKEKEVNFKRTILKIGQHKFILKEKRK